MSALVPVATFLGLMALIAVCSGSETGVYTVSRVHLDAEAERGGKSARLLRFLLRNDTALLITLLIGSNLILELLADLVRSSYAARGLLPEHTLDLAVALSLSPVVFVLGELLPKDTFRRRPRLFLGLCAWLVAAMRVAFLPLALPLYWLSLGLERLLGVRASELNRALGREEILELLRLGTRQGAFEAHVEELVANVFVMRSTPVTSAMIAWDAVLCVDLAAPDALARVVASDFTRLPVVEVGADGLRRVRGYVHQLDVLGAPERTLAESIRPLPELEPQVSVDRALARMQLSGVRIALVGTPERPLGLLATMDLVALIAGVRAA